MPLSCCSQPSLPSSYCWRRDFPSAVLPGADSTLVSPCVCGSAALAVVTYAIFAFIALERVDVTNVFTDPLTAIITMWVIAGYLLLSVLSNLASKSAKEKRVMVPLSLTLGILATVIAVG